MLTTHLQPLADHFQPTTTPTLSCFFIYTSISKHSFASSPPAPFFSQYHPCSFLSPPVGYCYMTAHDHAKMVHHHRVQQQQQQKLADTAADYHQHLPITYTDCCGVIATKKSASKHTLLLRFIGLFSLISCALVLAPRLLFPNSSAECFDSEDNLLTQPAPPPCASIANNTICCDRTAVRSDVCFMRGDVRTEAASKSLLLHLPSNATPSVEQLIRPYTRKWEANTMATIDELHLKAVATGAARACDVRHDVPAVFLSTGGYTGNVYHEFNDGIVPLYISSQHFNKQVVFVVLEYHDWWITKYSDVLSQLSDYTPIDFSNDKRTHCFPEAIVGLRIHDELAIDPAKMANNKSIADFRRLLDDAYAPRIQFIQQEESQTNQINKKEHSTKPKLVVVARNGSRAIENEAELAKTAEAVGFQVEILRPERTTELAKIYRALNSCDAMVGVHGAAMTHFMFMRPGSVFIQIVPLGTDWAAGAYYGDPAMKMGLRYIPYKILPAESSLYRHYEKDDPVLRDPESVNAKGWQETKKVYLDGQNVRLNLERFRRNLVEAHRYLVAKRRSNRKQKQRQGR